MRRFTYFALCFRLLHQKFNYIIIAVSLAMYTLQTHTHILRTWDRCSVDACDGRRVRKRHGLQFGNKKRVSLVNGSARWRDARPFKWPAAWRKSTWPWSTTWKTPSLTPESHRKPFKCWRRHNREPEKENQNSLTHTHTRTHVVRQLAVRCDRLCPNRISPCAN